ncbi:hypothetical protein BZA77DRAFT_290058 [Pyronema omphalodes]|nr:hypothetical protein BZA77DRAFT_290058 [Pyronema omphalodes]
MASSPSPRSSTAMALKPINASLELQDLESPVGTHEKEKKEEDSFEVPLFNFEEVIRYMRKLKDENTYLNGQLETMRKNQEKTQQGVPLQRFLQYGTVEDMEKMYLEKYDKMERKVEDMKRDIKEEIKQEMEKKYDDMKHDFSEMKK